jgi:surface protein
LNHLPFITTDNKLTINHANVYVNIQTDIDPNKKLVSVEIPQESFTFADNTTTNDGLSFSSTSSYYFGGTSPITEINILFFGNNGTQTQIIPLSRAGTQFGLSTAGNINDATNVLFTISNSDNPYILTNTTFTNMFRKLTKFNSDISSWSISNVTNMDQMFFLSSSFNQDISIWDVSKVTSMNNMFNRAIKFNNGEVGTNTGAHPLNWTTSALSGVGIEGMFTNASAFNQDISSFILSNVTSTQWLFEAASVFNRDISTWDVGKVINMQKMFRQAYAFNQDISIWNVSSVKIMDSMFLNASSFNQNLDNWNLKVSSVTNMGSMFNSATIFNNGGGVGDSTRPMTGWNVGSVTNHTNFANGSGLYYTGHPTGNIQPNYWEYSPTNPTNVSATYNTGSYNNYSVRLIWDTVIGANSYNVKLTTNNTTDTITSTGTSPYTFTGLNVEANTYSFSVQAVNSQGGSSGYSSATIPTSAVGTASATSGIDSLSINVADITLTGSNYGPFYKISTTPTTGVNPTTLSDSWTTSELLTNITCTRDNLITNFNYSFTITSYNIAGSASASSASITNFKPVNNFMFSYTATALPSPDTTDPALTPEQQQRKGIFNYLPFFKGTSAATGTLTLDSLLYTTNNYITWTTTSPYTVTVNFPKKYTDGTTDLWTYINTTNPGNSPQAGIAIDGSNTTINPYYRDMCQSISYNNFSSIPISNKGLFYIEGGYSKIFNITNNSIPIFLQGMSINLFTYITPSSTSSINLSNWDLSNATKSLDFAYFSNFSNVDINISNWDVRNITSAILFRSTQVKSTMPALNWTFSNLSGSAFANSFNGSNFNSPLNFKFSGTSQFRLERMFNGANSFNQNISTTYDSNGTPVYWDVSNVIDMANMFNTATNFNQNIGNWNVSNVGNMSQMFYKNETFNQDISNWDVSNVTDMSFMFGIESTSGGKFNQNISNWNVSKVNTMNEMFRKSINFNNGELGYTSISGANITPGSSYYTSSTSVLTCPSATCSASGLTTSDVVIITTSSIVYAAQITGITDTTLTLFPAYTSNINSGSITSITKQVVGTSPLTWNLRPGGVSLNQMFKECAYFNQRLLAKDGGSPWNMTNVSNVSSMFLGSSAKKNLFNNGYLITDTTHPLNWAFTATPTSTDWHTNCVLTPENGVTTPNIY